MWQLHLQVSYVWPPGPCQHYDNQELSVLISESIGIYLPIDRPRQMDSSIIYVKLEIVC